MKVSIYALEKLLKEYETNIANASKLLKEYETNIANASKQLKDLDAGKITLSALKIASVENTLEHSNAEYEKYKAIYDAIPEKEKEDFRNLQAVQELLAKESYYKLQKIRVKRNKNLKRNQRLEAMMVLDELPEDIHFDDTQLIEVTNVIIKFNARESVELVAELGTIREEFDKRIEELKDKEDLKHFHFLDTYIPIIVLHFASLVKSIEETIIVYNEKAQETQEEKTPTQPIIFNGFPKYEDWWFEELFLNHQAYFSLYQWKEKIKNICLSDQQKDLWEKIFSNWLMIKKILSTKDENAWDYNFIFDDMIAKYTKVEEEFDNEIRETNEKNLVEELKGIHLSKYLAEHHLSTYYQRWKNEKINKK